eukprot:4015059-Amphidinium_carterae.1
MCFVRFSSWAVLGIVRYYHFEYEGKTCYNVDLRHACPMLSVSNKSPCAPCIWVPKMELQYQGLV